MEKRASQVTMSAVVSLVVMTMKTNQEIAGGARPVDFVVDVPRSPIAGAYQ